MNQVLRMLANWKLFRLLEVICYAMYRLKGKKVRSVKYLENLKVWEFNVDDQYFLSTGPGWAYNYNYLLDAFKSNLGYYSTVKEGDIIVDVGAGVGEEVMILSKLVGPSGKVIAIEAHPNTYKSLEYCKAKNKLENVQILNVAVSDQNGTINIEGETNSLASRVNRDNDKSGYKIPALTIDQILEDNNLNRVDFLKVNIEGAEQLLIKGLKNSLSKIKSMAISCHDFRYFGEKEHDEFFKTKDKVLKFCNECQLDYKVRNTLNEMIDNYVYVENSNTKVL